MPARVHNRDVSKAMIGAGALALVVLITVVGIRMQMGGGLPAKTYTYVDAEFRDVGWLSTQADVVENGMRVGQVDSISHRDGRVAVVTIRLDGERDLYQDATARVSNSTVLGKRRIVLDPGTDAAGPLDGEPIGISRTSDSKSLDDLYSELDPKTRRALANSLTQLGTGVAGHGTDLRDFLQSAPDDLADLGTISAALADPDASTAELLLSASRLTSRFEGRTQELSSLLRQSDATFAALGVDGAEPLDQTVQALPSTLRTARAGLDAMNGPLADVRDAAVTLRPGATALGRSSTDLRGFLRESVEPLRKVPGVSESAEPALRHLAATMEDARPVMPRLERTLDRASVFLQDLAPYAPDLGRWASEHDLLSGRVRPGEHFMSLMLISPTDPVARKPYPPAGEGAWADQDRTGGGF